MHRVFRHLRVLWRAESAVTEARLRMLVRRVVLLALAGLIAMFGLCMLNAAAFLALEKLWGPIWAAIAAALGDFVLAAAVAGIAAALRPSAELNAATELRQAAIDGIEAEFADLRDKLPWRSHRPFSPLDVALPAILIPLITAIIRGLRKTKPDRP